jgi:enoyl-CoA hydratase
MSVVMLERPSTHVAVVRFNRPDVRNALNTEVRRLLDQHFTSLLADDDVRAVVLTGSERVFAAGADIQEQADRDVVGALKAYTTDAIASFPKPVIAAVNGYALGGGCEFALQCDFVIASERAKFGQPEVNLGLIPGAGGTQRLPRVIGRLNASYMLMTGTIIDARRAEQWGLVSEVVEGDALPRALELAELIASKAPLAVQQVKDAVRNGQDSSLEAGLRLERRGYQLMFGTQDFREGIAAFQGKREPKFAGE